ncbi:MAG: hypothetical protein N4A62_09995 [Marinisporobacter sp.]|jgi:hypothetical protein|nr:hypothetical protein [Marinisporobacter sp.]
MKNSSIKLEMKELKYLMRYIEHNKGIRIFLNRLMKQNKIKSKEYTVIKAEKFKIKDLNISFMVVGLKENQVKLVLVKNKQDYHVFGSIIEEENGKEIMKGYNLSNNHIQQIVLKEYDEKFKQELKKLEESEKNYSEKEKINKEGIPCIYGNWCGPGCSGPGAPISPVDACCKAHDLCYGKKGYFCSTCDDELVDCLAPYVVQGDKWAIIISKWFSR